MNQTRRVAWFAFSTVLLCALLGGLYGRRVEATTDASDDSDVQTSLGAFTKVYEAVERNYADAVDPDRAIFGPQSTGLGAIPGMLRTLDPHSNFLDPRTFELFREEQEAKYYGVGMRIQPAPGKMGKLVTIVLEPMPGSPAIRAGLRPGDIILRVDGQSVEGLDTTRVAGLLKGPKGTVVHITVDRQGQTLDFTVTRAQISPRSVEPAFMIRPGIAYIHVSSFNETTNEEFNGVLKKLGGDNLQGMILDLRENRGGLLQQAVSVSDHFLEKGQLIVYHSGRHSQEKRWYASEGNRGREYPMIVLIDHMTASAAEIVTGALQDHDRALVMGEPSFGKGLVQSEYPLSERTLLLLTTARYYTPSGRLIQRSYSDVSLWDYLSHSESANAPRGEVRMTDGGREVYGGGGITPDVVVHAPKATRTQQILTQGQPPGLEIYFLNFSKYYLSIHKTVAADFTPNDETILEFKNFLTSEKIQISDQEIRENLDFIKNRIRGCLVKAIYGPEEANKIFLEDDFLVQKAFGSMNQAAELLAHAKKYVASRAHAKMTSSFPAPPGR